MRLEERIPILFKLLLPLLVLLLLQVSPLPLEVTANLRRAREAQRSGQHMQQAEALRQVAARQPWRADALWEEIGRAELAAGNMGAARAALEAAAATNSLSGEGWLALGEARYQQGGVEGAEEAWREALRTGAPADRVHPWLARLASERGDYPAAVEALRAWRAASPADARAAYQLGLYLCVVQPDAALPVLLDAARLDPNLSGAVQALRRGLAQAAAGSQTAFGWVMIGRALGNVGQWALAEQAFRSATEADAGYGEAWAFLGEARRQNGGSGLAELRQARALSPSSTVVNAFYALTLRRQGQYQEALAHLQAVARQEPDEPFWLAEIAATLVEQGDLIGARDYYEQAAALAPNAAQSWQALARFSVQYNVDIRGLGLPAARKAVILAPDDPASLDAIGWALVSLGDQISGERFLQQALERDAEYAPANLHLAQLYLQRQAAQDAHFYLRLAAGQGQDAVTAEIASRLLRQYFSGGQ